MSSDSDSDSDSDYLPETNEEDEDSNGSDSGGNLAHICDLTNLASFSVHDVLELFASKTDSNRLVSCEAIE